MEGGTRTASPRAREIGARLRLLREGRALTQGEVAERAGMKTTTVISRIEHGLVQPRAKTIRRLADALGVEVGELTGRASLSGREEADVRGVPERRLAVLGKDAEEYEVWRALAETRAEAEGISKGDALWRLVDEQTILARAGRRLKPRLRSPEEMPRLEGDDTAAAAVSADRA